MAGAGLVAARLAFVRRTLSRARREPAEAFNLAMAILAMAALGGSLSLFPLDADVSRAMRLEPAGVRAFLEVLTDVGLILWYFYPAALVAVLLLATSAEPNDRAVRLYLFRYGVHSAYLAASLGLTTTVIHGLKWLLGRARPVLIDEEGSLSFALLRVGEMFESFPSGHSGNVGVLAVVLAIWFPLVRWPILVAGVGLAMSRIVVEAHYPSDVLAGFSIGALTALCLGRFLALRRIVYRVRSRGAGWSGLLPHRPRSCGT